MLEVNVLRGENRVGENLIEIKSEKKRILLDCGVPLVKTAEGKEAEKHVLETHYDAVIITHYHADHSGLLTQPIHANEIYMGKATQNVLLHDRKICNENVPKLRTMENERIFEIGDIQIKPYLCDHSAYDSYMIELIQGDKNVLYTGDFRGHGRKSFSRLLSRLPKKVEHLIIERTNCCRTKACETEAALEKRAVEYCKSAEKVFVLQSRLNVDRTVTFYRAAKRTGRIFIETKDSFEICRMLNGVPTPNHFDGCYTYLSCGTDEKNVEELKKTACNKILSRRAIAKRKRIVMQVHSGMLGYFREFSKLCDLSGSILFYSVWQGYKPKMQNFLDGLAELGIKTVEMHTSGHADEETIERLVRRVCPKTVSFVHFERKEYLS